MDQIKSTFNVCLIAVFLLFLFTTFSKASSMDQHIQKQSYLEGEEQNSAWKILFQAQLRQELAALEEAERQVVNKIYSLNEQRQAIRQQKRGHNQCFLNLVSCYRKRK